MYRIEKIEIFYQKGKIILKVVDTVDAVFSLINKSEQQFNS